MLLTEVLMKRPVEPMDMEALAAAFLKAWDKAKETKTWLSSYSAGDEHQVANDLVNNQDIDGLYVVNETYVVAYSIEDTSMSGARILREFIVLKIYDGPGTFADVVSFLNSEAVAWECCGIAVATALASSNDKLISTYQRYGFSVQSVELFKSV